MPLKTQADEQPSLNLTPMIDIVFLLIICFRVGTVAKAGLGSQVMGAGWVTCPR